MENIKEENIHSSLLIHLNIFTESKAKTKFAICENYNFHVSLFFFFVGSLNASYLFSVLE